MNGLHDAHRDSNKPVSKSGSGVPEFERETYVRDGMTAGSETRSRHSPPSRTMIGLLLLLWVLALMPVRSPAQQASAPAGLDKIAPVLFADHGANLPAVESRHYVVLVSLDGFRYDYASKYNATHLLALAEAGASVPDGMIPSYPSYTFPNHYTLVTGLYPEHHGIVANRFYDPERKQFYSYRDPQSRNDGSWYGGVPLWVLAEQQGMRSACFFWPGSEAKIDGWRPTYYLKFDSQFPDRRRIDQVIAWLKLPPGERPHLITLYYGNVDHAGHQFGPDSPETAAAVRQVDRLVGALRERLDELRLPIDLIVVSDHGMAREDGPWIDLDKYADLSGFITVGPLLYPKSNAAAEKVYQELKIKSSQFKVYRRSQLPAELHANANPRMGDPIVVATGPYPIRAHPDPGYSGPPPIGMHGFDPTEVRSMRAIFIAAGPDIRSGVHLRPFQNVNVYPLIAAILGLQAPKTDGNLNILSGILKPDPRAH